MNRKRKLTRMVQGLKASRLVSWHSSPCCCEEKGKQPKKQSDYGQMRIVRPFVPHSIAPTTLRPWENPLGVN